MVKFTRKCIHFLKNSFAVAIIFTVLFLFEDSLVAKFNPLNFINSRTELPDVKVTCDKVTALNIEYTKCKHKNSAQNDDLLETQRDQILRAIKNFPSAVLIDIGSKSGTVSLPAAKLGHQVISVDQDANNVFSLLIGKEKSDIGSNLQILHNKISELDGFETEDSRNLVDSVPSVTLETILEYTKYEDTILNIDSIGSDCQAITQYLWRKPKPAKILYVLMHWSNIFFKKGNMPSACDQFPQMVEGFRVSGYKPYTETGFDENMFSYTEKEMTQQDLMANPPEMIMWVHESAPLLSSHA